MFYSSAAADQPPLPLFSCLRNVVALFHVLEKELAWRKATGRPEGYGAMRASRPLVAVGPEHSLDDECLMADYFRMTTTPQTPPAPLPGRAMAAAAASSGSPG